MKKNHFNFLIIFEEIYKKRRKKGNKRKKEFKTRVNQTKCGNENEYLNYMQEDNRELEILRNSLFVSYSEFFRNSLTFCLLEHEVLPLLINNKIKSNQREIRILSIPGV